MPSRNGAEGAAPGAGGGTRHGRLIALAAGVGIALAGAVWLFLNDPAQASFCPRCPLHWATGLHCPTCGTLRAGYHLLHGDVRAAVRLNPLLLPALAFAAALAARPSLVRRPWVPWTALLILVLFGVLRNIPVWPLNRLGPG